MGMFFFYYFSEEEVGRSETSDGAGLEFSCLGNFL